MNRVIADPLLVGLIAMYDNRSKGQGAVFFTMNFNYKGAGKGQYSLGLVA